MLDTGVELLEIIFSAGGKVNVQDVNALLGTNIKKRKTNLVRTVLSVMERRGIPVDAQLRTGALSILA